MRYLLTNFTSATNPALTPIPFDSVVEEDATVDVAYGAAVGYLGGAGMKINWTGSPPTGSIGYGRKLFTTSTDHQFLGGIGNLLTESNQNFVRVRMAFRFPDASGFAVNNTRMKILRFNQNVAGTQTEVASISWVKSTSTATSFKLRIDVASGETATVSSNIDKNSYNNWLFLNVDFIRSKGCAFINVGESWPYTTSTQVAGGTVSPNSSTQGFTRLAFASSTSVPVITSVDVGSISVVNNGGTAIDPTAASEMNISDLFISDDIYPDLKDSKFCGTHEIDNVAVRLNYSYFADFGAITPDLGGYETFPTVQMAIVPGGVYEVSAVFAQDPPGDPITGYPSSGYTAIQTYQHSSEAFTFSSPPYLNMFNMGAVGVFRVQALPTHNALRIYNGQYTNAEYFVRRVR